MSELSSASIVIDTSALIYKHSKTLKEYFSTLTENDKTMFVNAEHKYFKFKDRILMKEVVSHQHAKVYFVKEEVLNVIPFSLDHLVVNNVFRCLPAALDCLVEAQNVITALKENKSLDNTVVLHVVESLANEVRMQRANTAVASMFASDWANMSAVLDHLKPATEVLEFDWGTYFRDYDARKSMEGTKLLSSRSNFSVPASQLSEYPVTTSTFSGFKIRSLTKARMNMNYVKPDIQSFKKFVLAHSGVTPEQYETLKAERHKMIKCVLHYIRLTAVSDKSPVLQEVSRAQPLCVLFLKHILEVLQSQPSLPPLKKNMSVSIYPTDVGFELSTVLEVEDSGLTVRKRFNGSPDIYCGLFTAANSGITTDELSFLELLKSRAREDKTKWDEAKKASDANPADKEATRRADILETLYRDSCKSVQKHYLHETKAIHTCEVKPIKFKMSNEDKPRIDCNPLAQGIGQTVVLMAAQEELMDEKTPVMSLLTDGICGYLLIMFRDSGERKVYRLSRAVNEDLSLLYMIAYLWIQPQQVLDHLTAENAISGSNTSAATTAAAVSSSSESHIHTAVNDASTDLMSHEFSVSVTGYGGGDKCSSLRHSEYYYRVQHEHDDHMSDLSDDEDDEEFWLF